MKSKLITQSLQINIDKKIMHQILDSLASELAEKVYYKFLLVRYLPEIQAIKKRKIKALKDEEIDEFLKRRMKNLNEALKNN